MDIKKLAALIEEYDEVRDRDLLICQICQLVDAEYDETIGTKGHNPYTKTEVKMETLVFSLAPKPEPDGSASLPQDKGSVRLLTDEQMKLFEEWRLEPCPHRAHNAKFFKPRYVCEKCWQALNAKV